MTIQEIGKIARRGEGLHVEFKKKAAHPEKIVKEIVAMANTDGGHLLIGVDDDGTVSGQRYIEEEVYAMDKAIRELILPPIHLNKHVVHLTPKKGVAVYEIQKSKAGPHFIWDENKKKAFVRVADKSIQASREMWEIMKRKQRQEDIIFKYGKKEELLMKELAVRSHITLKEYMVSAKIPIYIASRTLVKLVLANVIDVIPQESGDRFVPKQ
ncbi:Putative DNA-binding domain-containing protein [Cyclobacterium lianum]|uniref:Putative DNA-binding domain-containing protein n=1 Tax=Cyclobacterium lianum TaxID=388280 RepID=A0A1M7II29_9BACT|nr:ATP-binding protein [Cyclobacterium lianum]SHM40258.1 Putative DNA-binding domain-containing protein [Cyclobacterium lianum]